jgi:hypothetical protein
MLMTFNKKKKKTNFNACMKLVECDGNQHNKLLRPRGAPKRGIIFSYITMCCAYFTTTLCL